MADTDPKGLTRIVIPVSGSEFVFLGFVCERYSKLIFVPKSKFLNSASLLSSLLSFWGGGGGGLQSGAAPAPRVRH